jgi:hypothetical protein
MDPIRIFVKHEPHKLKKREEKSWRLIWSVGVIDRLVHDVYLGDMCQTAMVNYRRIPSKPGLGFSNGEWHALATAIDDGGQFISMDKSAWDISVPEWGYEAYSELGKRGCVNWHEVSDADKNAWDVMLWNLSCSRLMFGDGTLLQQKFPGMVKSGSLVTIDMNSKLQIFLKCLSSLKRIGHFDYEADMIVSMGDDTLERLGNVNVSELTEDYSLMGFKVKDGTKVGGLSDVDFCGMGFQWSAKWKRWIPKPVPEKQKKHLYNLRFKQKKDRQVLAQQLESYLGLYAYDDAKFELFRKKLTQVDVADPTVVVLSQALYQRRLLGYE